MKYGLIFRSIGWSIAVAGLSMAQSSSYTAASTGGGFAMSSFNGVATSVNPSFGFDFNFFLPQDGVQYPATWDGWFYGTLLQGPTVAPFAPPAPFHNPAFVSAVGWGACPGHVVGYALSTASSNGSGGGFEFQAPWHAVMWDSQGQGPVDLHNSNNNSRALACDGFREVGEDDNGPTQSTVYGTQFGTSHAVLWTGTAKSEIDLHSGPFSNSQANGISGAIQVGWGANIKEVQVWNGPGTTPFTVKSMFRHAVMWTGTPGSIRDLHPAGYEESAFMGVGQLNANGIKVGWARPLPPAAMSGSPLTLPQLLGLKHAMVWTNTGVIDLHQFLPAGYWASFAMGIDPITKQIVGGALTAPDSLITTIIWTPNP